MDKIRGRCLCGGVTFETDAEPVAQILCYCRDCQVVSGAPAYAAYIVPLANVTLVDGEIAGHPVIAESGRTNQRNFCTTCGSRLWAEIAELSLASVNGMALPPGHFRPAGLHRQSSAPDWCLLDERLPPFPAEDGA